MIVFYPYFPNNVSTILVILLALLSSLCFILLVDQIYIIFSEDYTEICHCFGITFLLSIKKKIRRLSKLLILVLLEFKFSLE